MSAIQELGFNWADWTIVAIVGISGLMSLARGFVREALSLLVWVVAFVVAFYFSEQASVLLVEEIPSPSLRYLAAFALLFVSVLLLGAVVNFMIVQLVKATGLSGTDRLLGMLFGVSRGVLIALAILVFAPKLLPLDQENWWKQSLLIPKVLVLEDWSRKTAAELSVWGQDQFEKHKPAKKSSDNPVLLETLQRSNQK